MIGSLPQKSFCGSPETFFISVEVLIVGGGTAGITVAAGLRRHRPNLSVAIVEPSDIHFYQPGWTLVGAGVFRLDQTARSEAAVIPQGVQWIKAAVSDFHSERCQVELTDGRLIDYSWLVVCPGLQLDWDKVAGLRHALGGHGVCSNYSASTAEYTWQCLQEFGSGKALFTQPPLPIKCAGAPQKIMYLAADHWRRLGLPQPADIEFCLAADVLFGVAYFVPALQKTVDNFGIKVRYRHTLTGVHGPTRTAAFVITDDEGKTTEVEKRFDMLHVTPPQSAPDFVKNSSLANATGWLDVDSRTLQHARYDNVFGLGDVAGTTNAKTAAAVRLQAPIVVRNLLAMMDGKPLYGSYDGYGSCPLTTAYGKVILAEFGYNGKVTPSFPFDPRKPRRSAWLLKTKLLPFFYWNMMLRGSEFDIGHRERSITQDQVA